MKECVFHRCRCGYVVKVFLELATMSTAEYPCSCCYWTRPVIKTLHRQHVSTWRWRKLVFSFSLLVIWEGGPVLESEECALTYLLFIFIWIQLIIGALNIISLPLKLCLLHFSVVSLHYSLLFRLLLMFVPRKFVQFCICFSTDVLHIKAFQSSDVK